MGRSDVLRSRLAATMAKLAETGAAIDRIMGKEPKAPKPEAPAGLGTGSRAYRVSDWHPTCHGCLKNGRCSEDKRECGWVKWFPIMHYVSLSYKDGVVVSSMCCDGRKPGGPPCSEDECKHVDRVLDFMGGKEDRGIEMVMVSGPPSETMPKCPNCRQRWSVSRSADGFECRNPTCSRDGKAWKFSAGDKSRPEPMRRGLVVLDREPGRTTVKRQG